MTTDQTEAMRAALIKSVYKLRPTIEKHFELEGENKTEAWRSAVHWMNQVIETTLQAALASQQMPEGYKLVPIERGGMKLYKTVYKSENGSEAHHYAMLAPAPAADREGL